MKSFVFVVCAALLCVMVQASPRSNGRKIHDECQALHYLDDDVFKAIHRGESFDRTLVGAHMLCMSVKLGTQNADGTINKEGLKTALADDIKDETELKDVVEKCNVEESTPGETALKLSQCVRENSHRGRHGHDHGHGHGHHHGHHHKHSDEASSGASE